MYTTYLSRHDCNVVSPHKHWGAFSWDAPVTTLSYFSALIPVDAPEKNCESSTFPHGLVIAYLLVWCWKCRSGCEETFIWVLWMPAWYCASYIKRHFLVKRRKTCIKRHWIFEWRDCPPKKNDKISNLFKWLMQLIYVYLTRTSML